MGVEWGICMSSPAKTMKASVPPHIKPEQCSNTLLTPPLQLNGLEIGMVVSSSPTVDFLGQC